MKIRWLLAIACTIIVGFAPVRASSDSVTMWRALFQTAIPAATTNFTSLRGAFDSSSANYAVKGPFYPRLVHDCIIFSSGAGDTQAWNLRCQLTGYSGQAMGPATTDGPFSARPGFGAPALQGREKYDERSAMERWQKHRRYDRNWRNTHNPRVYGHIEDTKSARR